MRKGRNGGKTGKKEEKKKKIRMKIGATMSLPAVDRPNADHWNAARSCTLSILFLRDSYGSAWAKEILFYLRKNIPLNYHERTCKILPYENNLVQYFIEG